MKANDCHLICLEAAEELNLTEAAVESFGEIGLLKNLVTIFFVLAIVLYSW